MTCSIWRLSVTGTTITNVARRGISPSAELRGRIDVWTCNLNEESKITAHLWDTEEDTRILEAITPLEETA